MLRWLCWLCGAALVGLACTLGAHGRPRPAPVRPLAATGESGEAPALVVATFNVRHGRALHGGVDLGQVAGAIAGLDVDLVGLQEVDVVQVRSGLVSQPARLAERLGFQVYFGPAMRRGLGFYGNVLLSRYPILSARAVELPAEEEPRSAIVARVDLPGGPATVVVTHLGLSAADRRRQLAVLAGVLRGEPGPHVVFGDWNEPAPPWPADLSLRDAVARGGGPIQRTFRWGGSTMAGDRIYVSPDWAALRSGVAPVGPSDHFPAWAELARLPLWG